MGKLQEMLSRTFYSTREAKSELIDDKNLSTSTPEEIAPEDGLITTSISSASGYGQSVDIVLAERNKLIESWRQMSEYPEVDEAIIEIVNEALVFDETGALPFEPDLENVEISDNLKNKMIEAFNKMIKVTNFKHRGEDYLRQWYIDGAIAFECIYNNKKLGNGIKSLKKLPPHNFYKVKDPKTKELMYFLDGNYTPSQRNQTFGVNMTLTKMYQTAKVQYKPEQINYTDSGIYSRDRLFPISYLNKAQKVVNDLQMMEESLLIYRFTRSPQRNAIYVDTGRLSKTKAEQYIKTLMLKHRNKTTYNTITGAVENRKKSINMQEDIWFGVNAEGRGTKMESLQTGSIDVNEIADLDYFTRKLWRSLNVPVGRRDPESRGNGISFQNLETENEEIKFYKFVLMLRKKFINKMFIDLMKKELISTKIFSLNDWNEISDNINFKYKNNNDFAYSKKLQNMEGMLNIASTALQLYQEGGLVNKEWIQSQIFNWTEDEIKEINKKTEEEKAKEPKEEEI